MKLIIEREALIAALAIVRPAANRSNLQILSHVAISTFDKSVEFLCNDLNLCLRSKAPAEVQEKGRTTVKAGFLFDLVKSLPGQHVQFELIKDVLVVTSAKSKYRLGTLPFDDFPPVTKLQNAVEFEMPQAILRDLLARTSFCACQDESRYVLMSSLLRVNGEETTAVATDGRRLSLNSGETHSRLKNARDIILPTFAVAELLRLLSSDDEAKPVTIAITQNAAQFYIADTHVMTKLIEGNYPSYEQVIPKVKKSEGLTLNREEFLSCLQRCALVDGDFIITVRNRSLSIETMNNKDMIGEAYETILLPPTGLAKPIKSKVKGNFLIEPLKTLTDEEVLLFITDGLTPMVLKTPKGPWLTVIMPLRDESATTTSEQAGEPVEAEAEPA